jgi:tetratricopeptide (TPR) repeat protein
VVSTREEQAQRAEQAGNFEEAFDIWRGLALESRDEITFCLAGRAAERAGMWSDAEEMFKQALRIHPMSPEAAMCVGSLFLNRSDGEPTSNLLQARDWLLRAIRLDRTPASLMLLGCTYRELKNAASAKEVFNEVLLLDPSNEEAYLNLALLEEDQDRPEALRLYRKAIELDPNYGEAHQRVGVLLHERGSLVEAEYHFRRCLEIDPQDYMSTLYLANTLAVQERFQEAEQMYRAAVVLPTADAAGFEFLARFLEDMSRKEEAKEVRARKPVEGSRSR